MNWTGNNTGDDNTQGDKRRDTTNREDDTAEKIELKVAEANSKDVRRRVARIDPKISEELGLSAGDVIEISSEKSKASVLNWLAYEEDYGKGLIRIDAT